MATKEATVQEGAEQVIDGLEEIAVAAPGGINKGVLLAGGVIIGVSTGFLIAKRILEKKYAKLAEEEIEVVRDLYFQKTKKFEAGYRVQTDEKAKLDEVVEKAGYATPQDRDYTDIEQVAVDEANRRAAEAEAEAELEISNVFSGEVPNWDWTQEMSHRGELDNDVPYVLHRDEYHAGVGENESGYEQITLTYFEGDDVLADSQDTPVDDQDAMVGLGNLTKFGHGSGDPNVVYIRNPELHLEIEVIHSDGKFSEQVRGIAVDPPRDETGKFLPREDQGDPRKRRSRGSR